MNRIDLMKERFLKPTLLLCRRVAQVIGLKNLYLVEWRRGDHNFGGAEAIHGNKHFRIRWGLIEMPGASTPWFQYEATWDHINQTVQAEISAPQLLNDADRKAFAVTVGNRMAELFRQGVAEEPIHVGVDDDDIQLKHLERQIKRMDN